MWIARDLGYRGGRRTGVPLADDVHLPLVGQLLGGVELQRATKGPLIAERTYRDQAARPTLEYLSQSPTRIARSLFK
jgi:hypothetical protein